MDNAHLQGHKSLAEMVSTHICVWRDSLTERLQNALESTAHNDDEISYIRHELKALADIEAACKTEMGSK